MNRSKSIVFFLIVLISVGVMVAIFGVFFPGITPPAKLPDTNLTATSAPSIPSPATLSILESVTTPPIPVVNYTSFQQDKQGCPVILTNPPEEFVCPRELQPKPDTYHIADPAHPTQKEIDAIPVNFHGVDRTLLVTIAIKDPCVIEFLRSGGDIEGISGSPRPTTKTEGEAWPPVLYADRWINCTDMRVFFDIDPSAGNISRIKIEML
jgi:hypothetical protein